MPRRVPAQVPRLSSTIASSAVIGILLLMTLIITNRPAASGTDPANQALVERGRAVYSTSCAACHGGALEGQPNWKELLPSDIFPAPPHDASGHTWHHPDDLLFTIVKEGGAAPLRPGEQRGMPAFGPVLSDADIWAVLSYIKSAWPTEIQQHQTTISRQQ